MTICILINSPILIFHIPTNIIHLFILSLSSSLSIFFLSLSIFLCYCLPATNLPLLSVSFCYLTTKSINTKINKWSKFKINIETPNQHHPWNTKWTPPLEQGSKTPKTQPHHRDPDRKPQPPTQLPPELYLPPPLKPKSQPTDPKSQPATTQTVRPTTHP